MARARTRRKRERPHTVRLESSISFGGNTPAENAEHAEFLHLQEKLCGLCDPCGCFPPRRWLEVEGEVQPQEPRRVEARRVAPGAALLRVADAVGVRGVVAGRVVRIQQV